MDCFKQIILNEGPLSLFRGMSGLFLFATPRFALIFHGNSLGLKCVQGAFDGENGGRYCTCISCFIVTDIQNSFYVEEMIMRFVLLLL